MARCLDGARAEPGSFKVCPLVSKDRPCGKKLTVAGDGGHIFDGSRIPGPGRAIYKGCARGTDAPARSGGTAEGQFPGGKGYGEGGDDESSKGKELHFEEIIVE